MSDPIDRLLMQQNLENQLFKIEISYILPISQMLFYIGTTEQEQVTQSLLPILKQSRPSNLLVYGKPGTGKNSSCQKSNFKNSRES